MYFGILCNDDKNHRLHFADAKDNSNEIIITCNFNMQDEGIVLSKDNALKVANQILHHYGVKSNG